MTSSNRITRRQLLAGAAAGLAAAAIGCDKEKPKRRLFVYNWPYYMSNRLLLDFEKKYGAQLVHMTYDSGSDEELPQVLSEGRLPVDVVVPGGTVLRRLMADGLLLRLDRSRLPNFENLLEEFVGRNGDKRNEFSVPYMWGTIGVGVNATKIADPPATWKLLHAPGETWKCPLNGEMYPAFVAARRIGVMSTPWEAFVPPLKMLGQALSGEIPQVVLDRATRALVAHRKTLSPEPVDQVIGPLTSGKLWVAEGYSGDVLQARKVDRSLAYLIPQEGTVKWLDTLSIPANAQNVELAYDFINYILDGEVSAGLTNEIWYASPNGAAYKHIRPEILKDTAIFPREETLAKCEFLEYDEEADRRLREAFARVTGG